MTARLIDILGEMKEPRLKNPLSAAALCALILLAGVWLFNRYELIQLVEAVPYNEEIRGVLTERLTSADALPSLQASFKKNNGAIYVLGGSQGSLDSKFKAASMLYRRGVCSKVLVLSKPGETERAPVIANDAWAVKRLRELGVAQKDMEMVRVDGGNFGTLNEAETLSRIASGRGYGNLLLITAPYHTKRVRLTFSKYAKGKGIDILVYPSDETASLRSLITEYLKLAVYRYVLL